ncbi:alpha-1,2-fucosyltransferase [Neobacillus soli]|uniref:alpha-1,2-fucosyltransferase n=1 Tax=Neobacillus soli TaxID=220688 RepID=UPI000824921A|nr:alpha-1,2-fucosyltransferase [Neobacillus soli]
MFIVNIRGGLGNQMFQYAYAIVLREKYGEKIRFSQFYIKRETAGRTLSLQNLNVKELKCLNPFIEKIVGYYFKIKLLSYEKKAPEKNGLLGFENIKYLAEKGLTVSRDIYKYFNIPIKKGPLKYVDGYFQSEKYFYEYKDIVVKELRVSDNKIINSKNKGLLEVIENSESVCVHIRRGDYTSNQWKDALLICDEDYYKSAVNYIKLHKPAAKFFVFSNSHEDIEWIKMNYKLEVDVEYVDLNNCDYEDLRLMYHCKNFILSNSSYSWWAQYLSFNKNKIVVAPSKWTRMNLDASDVYMEQWKIIDV